MSHITFKKLVVDSFLSYDHVELQLDMSGITYIKGTNNADSKSSSNGSGKSALISESLLWCLTGQTSRNTKIVTNLYLERGASVTVGLEKEGHYYEITRGTHKSIVGNGIFIIKDGVSVTKPRIVDNEEYLKTELQELDWQVMTSILILSQGLVNGFSTLANRDRKESLEKLANMESVFLGVKNMADNAYTRLLADQTTKSSVLVALNAQVNANNNLISSLNFTIQTIEAKNAQIVSADVKEQQTAELKRLIQARTDDSNSNNIELTGLTTELTALNNKTEESNAEYVKNLTALNSLNSAISTLDKQIQSTTTELNNVIRLASTAVETAICPTCLQPIKDDVAAHVHTQYEDTKTTLSKVINDTSVKQVELSARIESLKAAVDSSSAKLATDKAAAMTLNMSVQSCVNKARVLADEIALHNNTLKSLDVKADSVDVYRTQISELVVKNNNLDVEVAGAIRALSEAEKQASIAKWLVAQTTRAIRSYMLEGVINYLNMKCSEYSEYLFDDSIVRLETDGSSLDIYLGNKLVENISGGEHRRLDIILQLAIRDLVMMQVGFTSNILVIDEVFDHLDNLGMVTVLDLITSQRDIINSIFLITHKNDADLDYDRILNVEKGTDNISRIT